MDNRYNELNKLQQAQVDGIVNAVASWRTKQDVIDRIFQAAMQASKEA
jgi:hypothetical protein